MTAMKWVLGIFISLTLICLGFLYLNTGEKIISIDFTLDSFEMPLFTIVVDGEVMSSGLDLGAKYSRWLKDSIPHIEIYRSNQFITNRGVFSENVSELCQLKNLNLNGFYLDKLTVLETTEDSTCLEFENDLLVTSLEKPMPFVLGFSFFLGKTIFLDYKNSCLHVANSREPFFKNGLLNETFFHTKLVPNIPLISIEAECNGEKKVLVVDTGSTFNYLKQIELPENESRLEEDQVIYLDEIPFQIGQTYYLNHSLDTQIDGFLGAPFFKRHLVAIDLKNKEIWIKPN